MIRACAVADLPEGEAVRLDGPAPIERPLHAARFDLRTGAPVPAVP